MASGVMTINYGSSSVMSAAKHAISAFESSRKNIQDVRNKLGGMEEHSGRRYLGSASAFLRKKTEQYETRKAALGKFRTQADNLMNSAENADKRVADHLMDSFETFKQVTGLQSGFWATLGKIVQGVGKALLCTICPVYLIKTIYDNWSDITSWIKGFYEKNKYWLDLAGNFVLAVLAIAAAATAVFAVGAAATVGAAIVAVIGAVGAVIAATSAVINVMRSSTALASHMNGDDSTAEELRKMSAADYLGLQAEALFGWDADVVSNIYTGIEIVGLLCNLTKGFFDVKNLAGGVTSKGLISKYRTDGFWKTVGDNLFKKSTLGEAKLDIANFKSAVDLKGFFFAARMCEIDNTLKFTSQIISTVTLGKELLFNGRIDKVIFKALGIGDGYKAVDKAIALSKAVNA